MCRYVAGLGSVSAGRESDGMKGGNKLARPGTNGIIGLWCGNTYYLLVGFTWQASARTRIHDT